MNTTDLHRPVPRPRPIGFIDPDRARQAQAALQTSQTRPQAQGADENQDTLLRFDGGERVSFLDASHNLLALGTTGSGKTASVLLPGFDRLCAAGFGGIAIDSKGSLAPLLRAVARRHGRDADVVEIGPYEGAVRINLLAGRDRAEAAAVLQPLLLGYCAHDGDRFWRQTGFEQFLDACDIAEALCRRAGAPLGLHIPARMLADSAFALGCFERFKAGAVSPAERELVARIEDMGAHIVPCSKKRLEERLWREQTTYYASAIRTGMAMLRAAPGIAVNFFAADGEPLDIGAMVFDRRRIVVLRLSPDSGETGAGLARLLLRQFYASVFARGKALPTGQYVFCLCDELQDYFNSNSVDPLNDASFLAKCREFKCIYIGGTQSAIALAQRAAGGLADVRAALNNCNVRIFFYLDDPETQRLAGIASEDVLLHELEPGQCILAHYDASVRRHEASVTSANDMYAAMRPVLNAVQPAEDRTAVQAPDEAERERDCQHRLVSAPEVKPMPTQSTQAMDEIVEETPAETALASVRHRGMDLAHVPEALRTPEVCLAAVHQDGMALRYVPEALKTLGICLEAVRQDGLMLAHVPMPIRTPELCMEAVMQAGQALEFVPETLKTEELCLEAMMQDGMALAFVPEALKTPALYLEAVQSNGRALQYVPAWLRTQDLCLAAVRNDGVALEWVPARLRTPEMCMEAVHSSGWALQFVPPALKTMELCLVAVRRSTGAATLLPDVLASDAVSAQRPRAGARAGRSGGPRLAGIPCRPRRRHGGIPCR